MVLDIFLYTSIGLLVGAGILVPIREKSRRRKRQNALVADVAAAGGLTIVTDFGYRKDHEAWVLRCRNAGLQVEFVPSRSASRRRYDVSDGTVTIHLPQLRFSGGLLVVFPRLADRMGEALQTIAGALDNPVGARIARDLVGLDIGHQIGSLRDCSGPDAPDVTILSVVDPRPFFDIPALAQCVGALPWREKSTPVPCLVVSESGSIIKTAGFAWELDVILQLIGTARALARNGAVAGRMPGALASTVT